MCDVVLVSDLYSSILLKLDSFICTSLDDVPPVIATPHYYLVSIYRNKMYLVSVIQSEGEV